MTRQVKRTKKGRFAKGTGGGPGRKKRQDGEVPTSQAIRDAFYKTFVQIFVKSGDPKELVDFCKKNQLNMRLLIQEVRKILPDLAIGEEKGQLNIIVERKILNMSKEETKDLLETVSGDRKKEEKVLIESLTTEQLEEQIKVLEKKKEELKAVNEAREVN